MYIAKIIWFLIGLIALILGVIGIFLPILPTVPFLLLAALSFSKSSTTFYNWLISHQHLGPPITEWRNNGIISRNTKIYAGLSMIASVALTIFLSIRYEIIIIEAVILLMVSIFIWSRPEA
ncbi:MAG: YbaN family protein [Rhodobacteraceae bacterium]|nr:YbaN family protein [Paracoccaceae bacterium]